MAGRQLGDAYITISPDTRLFRTQADAAVKRELAGFNPKVRIGADTKDAQVAIASFQKRVGALSKQLSGLRADAKTKDAESKVASVQARVLTLAKQMRGLTMTADAKKLDAQIAGEVAKLKGLQHQMSHLQADANTKAAAAKITGLEKQAFHLQDDLNTGKLKARVDIKDAEAKLKSIDAQLRLLGKNARAVKLAAENKVILTQIEVVKASLSGLQAQAKDIRLGANLDPAKLLAAEAALLGIEHVVEALGKKDVPVAGTAMGAFFSSMNRGSTAAAYGWKILTGHITLMGGVFNRLLPKMFTSVAVWHLLIDAAIEILAVWAPAIVAVTAFGVAGADAAKTIYNRMVAVHTVMDATGQAVPPLTNNFKHLAAAVKPEVYQLFGDALLIMGRRGGAFNTVALATGRVLDQLAARFVFAVTTGGGVNKFMEHAVQDVAKLGDSIGNLGGIFGAVFKAVPGYAEILLSVGDAITKVLETATRAAEPVIALGLKLHGFFIYGGLAITVSLALVAGIVKLIGAFGKFNEAVTLVGLNSLKAFVFGMAGGIRAAIGYTGALISLAASEGVVAAGSIALADAQALLARIPTTFWAIAAAAALITLVHAIITSRDAAQQFNTTLQQTIQNAPLANVITTIQQAQAVTAARLASTTRELNKAVKENTVVNAGRAGALNSNGTAIQNLDNAQRHYTEGVVQLSNQQKLVVGRFAGLSKEYGNNTAALGALNAAGITTAQITDTNKDHWAQALIQVHATTAAYAAMGSQAGVLGNDLDVLGRTVTDQYQAVQKLNQGWSAFITDVTGTQGAFDTVAQGFFTLQDHAGKLTFSLGKLKIKYADQKAAIDSLTPAGIALNQAFGEQVQNVDKLFASWRTAGISGKQFTSGVQAAIGPLVKYAAGSQEATAQLVALAEEAGYQGPISLQALTKWLGNTHGAVKRLKDITNQATAQEALLTGAMQAQGNFITSQLLGDIDTAALKYFGVSKAVTAYGTAIAQSGKGSDKAKQKMTTAVLAIVQAEQKLGDNTSQMAAVVSKTFGVSMPEAMKLVQGALVSTVNGVKGAQGDFERFAIKGLKTTADRAGELWAEFKKNNLEELVNKTNSSRSAFDKLASKGLGISRDAADQLWKHLRQQYLDELARKGNITRDAFIKLATKGLDLTKNKAQDLWNTLHRQQLTDAANKAGETRAQFQHLAAQLGVTKGYADRLWASLHKVSSGSPYFVVIKEKGTGLFTITGPGIGKSQGPGGSKNAAGGLAAGGYIGMGSGPTADDVPIMASRGEYVVKAASVAKYGQGTMDAINAGTYARGGPVGRFASGGLVPDGGLNALAGATTDFHADFYNTMTGAMKSAMTRALVTARNAAMMAAATAGGMGDSGARTHSATVAQAYARSILSQYGWGQDQMSSLIPLWNSESGWNAYAANPTSNARGIPQSIQGWASYAPGDYKNQIIWGLNYIRGRYGSPAAAWSFWQRQSPHWYSEGGPVQKMAAGGLIGMASGGRIPVGSYLSQLKRAQGNEYGDYAGLKKAYLADLRHARPGSWTSGHKASIRSVLGTLDKRQSLEEAGYDNILHHGTAAANLSKFRTRIRDVRTSTRTKTLSHSHPNWSHGLQYWLGVLTHLSDPSVVPVYGGTQAKLQFPAWLAKAKTDQAHEVADYRGLQAAFKTGLSHARRGTWLYQNRRAIGERLYAVAIRQNAEAAAYADLIKHSSGSVSDLTGLAGRIAKLGSTARAESGSLQPALLGHIPGGHPGWLKALQAQLKLLTSLAAAPPYNPPWAPGNLGPSHTAPGGVLRFDTGRGVLAPGMNLAWNGTGRNEALSSAGAGGGSTITLEFAGGGGDLEQLLFQIIRRSVRVRGGGDVQVAFGRG